MTVLRPSSLAWLFVAALAACTPRSKEPAAASAPGDDAGVLLRAGSIAVRQADLDHQIAETHGGRKDPQTREVVLGQLAARAQMVQAAIDDGLMEDSVVRAEIARVLANRYRELKLTPRVKSMTQEPVPASRLRELYDAAGTRFRSSEQRQVAVLWLNPGDDPTRKQAYQAKLAAARDWLLGDADLKQRPEQGFGTLAVDHSEHQASRYQGGVVGWIGSAGNPDAWSRTLAGLAFSLAAPGDLSEVTTAPEGLFLVRLMAVKPAVERPLEAVANELRESERARLIKNLENEFLESVAKRHPVRWQDGAAPADPSAPPSPNPHSSPP